MWDALTGHQQPGDSPPAGRRCPVIAPHCAAAVSMPARSRFRSMGGAGEGSSAMSRALQPEATTASLDSSHTAALASAEEVVAEMAARCQGKGPPFNVDYYKGLSLPPELSAAARRIEKRRAWVACMESQIQELTCLYADVVPPLPDPEKDASKRGWERETYRWRCDFQRFLSSLE